MEEWRIIKEFPNYEVSSLGRVRHRELKQIKKSRFDRYGYYRVHIHSGGKNLSCYPHILVAITFLNKPDKNSTVNHKNGIKIDNRLENLEWCSRKENFEHGKSVGLIKCKLDWDKVKEIRRLLSLGILQKDIAKQFNVSKPLISNISRGKAWKSY